MFQKHKSIEELEEESEQLDAELDVKRKRAMLAELNHKGGNGFWKRFSSDGTKRGLSWEGIKSWLSANKTH